MVFTKMGIWPDSYVCNCVVPIKMTFQFSIWKRLEILLVSNTIISNLLSSALGVLAFQWE